MRLVLPPWLYRSALLLALVSLAACDESVSPTLDTGRPFSLWGSLDPTQELQALRIIPIEQTLEPQAADLLDAEVVSRNLVTGETVVWEDSLIEFAGGAAGWVVTAPFQAAYGESYRITATRSDGAVSAVNVRVPERVTPIVADPTQSTVEGVRLPVIWPDTPRIHDVEVTYLVGDGNCRTFSTSDPFPLVDFTDPFEYGWETSLPLSEHATLIRRERGALVSLSRVNLRGLVADGKWKPPFPFAFDPEIIIEPGTISNVENGFGFVGASYRVEIVIVPNEETLRSAGFISLCD
jgi:hypothetical protein